MIGQAIQTSLPNARGGITSVLFRGQSLPVLLAASFAMGTALTMAMLPLSVILGGGSFWDFPAGTVPGGIVDMAQTVIAYRYYAAAPWMLPLLQIPNLVPPNGTNLLWLDAVPLLCLAGRLAFEAGGAPVNLIGFFLFLCFALPGAVMTAVFWAAGQRGLFCALAAAALANSMPFFLFEWGHVALCAQLLIIGALLLYVLSQQRPADMRITFSWTALLLVTLLTSNYLFVMVGGFWFAALLQIALDRRVTSARLAAKALAGVVPVVCVAIATGILTPDLRYGGTDQFGGFSMNLGSPFVPQMSGVLPPFQTYWIGMRSQVFDYVGLGVLFILAVAMPVLARWARSRARSHIALIGVLTGFFLFALSNRITLGSHTLLEIPLPETVAHWLGAFRASGRFFWPVGYAAAAVGTLAILQSFRPRAALVILTIASMLQVADSAPQRRAIAASTSGAVTAVIDRQQVSGAMAQSFGIIIFPTTGCVDDWVGAGRAQLSQAQGLEARRVLQATVELQMLASIRNLPINSALTDRLPVDCAAETAERLRTLRPGVGYFYLTGFIPGADQLDGHSADKVCRLLGGLRHCLLPADNDGRHGGL